MSSVPPTMHHASHLNLPHTRLEGTSSPIDVKQVCDIHGNKLLELEEKKTETAPSKQLRVH